MSVSIAVLLLVDSAWAITRSQALERADALAQHQWTMGAENEVADCSSGYKSDYGAGETVRGLPYAWGGNMDAAQFDARLAEGQGAGSHSWHGVLSCVAGVDCSGLVTQAWGLERKVSTSSVHTVSTVIALEDIRPGDAFNKAGSHIVLYTGMNDEGEPMFLEASGSASRVRSHSGWSYLSGYTPIRYNEMEEDPVPVDPEPTPEAPIDTLPETEGPAGEVAPVERAETGGCSQGGPLPVQLLGLWGLLGLLLLRQHRTDSSKDTYG